MQNQNIVYHWKEDRYWEYHRSRNKDNEFIPIRPTTWQPKETGTPVASQESPTGILIVQRSRNHSFRVPPRHTLVLSFSQYVNSLSTWEKYLLQGIHLKYQPYEILNILNQAEEQTRTLLVSDGSQRTDFTTYGWVFGSEHNEIYAEHAGEGFGECTSHRAEAWGMLSGIVFLNHLYIYTNGGNNQSSNSTKLTLLSDNNGLVTRVKMRLTYNIPYPNATLALLTGTLLNKL